MLPLLLVLHAAPAPTSSARALAALAACERCHRAPHAEGGFDFVLDRERLVRERLVVPFDPEGSLLVQRVAAGEMPPTAPPARRAELARVLTQWVKAGAPADAFAPALASVDDPWSAQDEAALILDDLEQLPESSRPFARYFSLGHLRRAGVTGPRLSATREALLRALNSLSWSPTLVRPEPLDPQATVLRVDLRALQWPAEAWEQTLLNEYPYGMLSLTEHEERACEMSRSRLPVVRADWFVATATRPPLYNLLLHLPRSETELWSVLRIDPQWDLEQHEVLRAGFTNSGVSQNNRLLERHQTRFGAYWRSYDFASSIGVKNLFSHPLRFEHDGGEHIFTLPNGLSGYLLTDRHGQRLDRASTAIVTDARRPDGTVENGLSCMGCHARGFIDKTDEVREAVEAAHGAFTAFERREVDALYPPPRVFSAAVHRDTDRFVSALAALGVPHQGEEPVSRTALTFEAALDARVLAAELGLSQAQLLAGLSRLPAATAAALGPLRLNGTVKRDTVNALFAGLVTGLTTQQPLRGISKVSEPDLCAGLDGTLAERIADCSLRPGAQRVVEGAQWSLVSRLGRGREVWRDDQRRLVWGPAQGVGTQRDALERCGAAADELLPGAWFVPSAGELEDALARALPQRSWQAVWTRDLQTGHKFHARALAVEASGRRDEHDPSERLAVRCVSRG